MLLDSIGPRLTGSPGYMAAADWAVKTYASWGIPAEKQQYGTWNSWRRGHSHVDLITPRVRSLEAMMLGWSPGTGGKDVIGDVVLYPETKSPEEFAAWAAANAKGKFVLISAPLASCRMASQWNEFGQPGASQRLAAINAAARTEWADRTKHGGNINVWTKQYGVAGVIGSNWSQYPGINKIFGSPKQTVLTLDAGCEDYNLLFRLAQNNQGPKIRVNADAEFLGELPMYNVVGMIKGSEKPNEYILLSAHFDSWDGGSGATDNGTGTITMMEAIRILKKVYPNPKRTIIIGNWGSEEQGLNGSQAFAEDHPEIIKGIRAGWNQDNGTGRVTSLSAGPVTNATDNLISWLYAIPSSISGWVRLGATASPVGGSGSTDNWTFQCRGAPVHGMGALGWDYGNTTWHTNRDTYDKVVIEDLK
ncbi:MAG TPA: M20/M25/M40 family metallo-hydrolase, partial [Gemmatimonadales bacterium]|nr:M20/M25/M40 family metallo-hydrolase [Gemmatimonadales bacterium]